MSRPSPAALLSLKGRMANSAGDNGVPGTIAAAEAARAARPAASAAAPRPGVHDWGTRAAAVSSLAAPPAFRCSQLEVPPRLGPTAALAPKTQSRLSRPGAGYGDFWRDRCGRAGSSGGGTSCRGSSATYFLVAHGDRSPGNYTNIASFLLKICGGNMRIDAPFCLKTQQYSLEQADGAEHWLR